MRLHIIGSLNGQIGAASKIAMSHGAKVTHSDDIESALKILRSGHGADLLMVDVKLDIHGLISSLESERIIVPVVACGLENDTEAAVKAIQLGAKEYIPLPPNAELIAAVLEAVTKENHAIITRDPLMAQTLKLAEQVAPSMATALIVGESGTGKELVARHIHIKSRRAGGKFISINCAAIPENLLESELFGHEKGAFTGAVARRIGKFEEANGGTLLLDEVSEMDSRLQAKLLRAIQEREIDRVGSSHPIKVDIRLIATSNRDLEDCVRKGTFREDLFFRLNVVTIQVPPLRDRPLDIEILAKHFAIKYAECNDVPVREISEAAWTKLSNHPWRGNVRELENTIHRAVLLSVGDEISPDSVMLSFNDDCDHVANGAASAGVNGSAGLDADGSGQFVGQTVAEVERNLIVQTLSHCLGNRTHAANILGISIRTLRNKLKLYTQDGIKVPMPGRLDEATI